MRDQERDGEPIMLGEIESWTPRDDVEKDQLHKQDAKARTEEDAASSDYQQALKEADLAREILNIRLDAPRETGIGEPLTVPDGYDFNAARKRIEEGERESKVLLRKTDTRLLSVRALTVRLDKISVQLNRDDKYRANEGAPDAVPRDLESFDSFVDELRRRSELRLGEIAEAKIELEDWAQDASDVLGRMGEASEARGVKASIASLQRSGVSWGALTQTRRGLEEHSNQFEVMAENLRYKLRVTDESVDDLVNRAVDEGYMLLDELHHLVSVSRVNIAGGQSQGTIDFRSRNRTILAKGVKRDEVATSRLKRNVRTLITEVLPKTDDATRERNARSRLEPWQLVYLLLDDSSVEVKFPVIRGGRGLSYESARDASGSGSTGQKSAGFVIAFLALLRCLGSVGSLSSEKTLFVSLESQFGKISSFKIMSDIKEVADQTSMQLITVAGRELRWRTR